MFTNQTILITGGTGSFGKKFIEKLLHKYKPNKIIVYSRDELKQFEMQKIFPGNKNTAIRYFIGDIRDLPRLRQALDTVDIVVHAAALKHVPIAEYNPFEAVKTNIIGSQNVIDASLSTNVKKVIALSTDKAAAPINLYGATKLASDKLFIASNSSYANGHSTSFSVVRYGNVMGSRGSIIPFFLSLKKKEQMPITDKRMTRFMISLDQGVKLVWHTFNDMLGGEIYVKKIPSIKITDIARVISPKSKLKIIGIRPGEKLHEQMISSDDSHSTYEYSDYYKILPQINEWGKDSLRIKNGKKVSEGFVYSSDKNLDWMTKSELKKLIISNKNFIGKF